VGITDVVAGFADGGPPDPDARLISATCGGLRLSTVYVPNGRALDHEHYRYKLDWLARLRRHLVTTVTADQPVVVAGDFNIAPTDDDVYDAAKFVDATHTSPPERAALADIEAWGLEDVFRRHVSARSCYSWWDYRAGDFHQGRGMRIDLVYGNEAFSYNHHQSLTKFKDRYVVSWSSGFKHEDHPGQEVHYATSSHGTDCNASLPIAVKNQLSIEQSKADLFAE
jgi:exodeoxyribonuclease-3